MLGTGLTGTKLFFQVSKIPTIVGVAVLATKHKYFYSWDWAAANRNCNPTIEGVGNEGVKMSNIGEVYAFLY